jgi:hypothetical protein
VLRRPDHAHLGRPEQSVAEPIARLEHLADPAVGGARSLVVELGLVKRRVERLALGAETLDAQPVEGIQQAMAAEGDALDPRIRLQCGWDPRQRPVEVVQEGDELAEHVIPRVGADLGPLALRATLIVQEVGPLAAQLVKQRLCGLGRP